MSHISVNVIPMSTYESSFVPTYIEGNMYKRIPSVGIDTERIPASSMIAKAMWARLAWQHGSALGEGAGQARLTR